MQVKTISFSPYLLVIKAKYPHEAMGLGEEYISKNANLQNDGILCRPEFGTFVYSLCAMKTTYIAHKDLPPSGHGLFDVQISGYPQEKTKHVENRKVWRLIIRGESRKAGYFANVLQNLYDSPVAGIAARYLVTHGFIKDWSFIEQANVSSISKGPKVLTISRTSIGGYNLHSPIF